MPQALTLDKPRTFCRLRFAQLFSCLQKMRGKKVIFAALASAVVVSLIYGLPYFLIKNQLVREGKIYSPITIFSDGDEAQIYAPFIKEAEEGNILSQDPALKEYGSAPSLMPPLGPFFLGLLSRLVGIGNIWILADFLFPALIFLVFFVLVYEIIGKAFISLTLSGIFIFAREAASLIPFSTFHQFKSFAVYFKPYISGVVENRLSFDRLLAPEWTFLPLGIFFLLLIISLKKKKPIFYALTGIFLGILFYSYPYDWISALLILGVNLFVQLLSRDSRGAMLSMFAVISALFISIPYWFSFWEISHYPQYKELLNRTGLEVGRSLRIFLTPHFVLWLGLSAWLLSKKKENSLSIFSASIFITAFLLMNIHVFTGYVPQPDHFLRYSLSFALAIAYIILARELWLEYNPRLCRYKPYFLASLILALALVLTRSIQLEKAYAEKNSWRYSLEKNIYDSLLWIDGNIPEDSVFLSPSVVTNAHLLIFTKSKVFVPSTGVITTASDGELVERFIIAAKVFGMNDADILKLFSQESLEKSSGAEEAESLILTHLFHYSLYAQDINSSFKSKKFRRISDIEKLAFDAVSGFNKNPSKMINKYEINYIYNGLDEKKIFTFSADKSGLCLNNVYNKEDIEIYRVCN